MAVLLWIARGVVEAPVERVADLIFEGYERATDGDTYVKQVMDRGRRRLTQEGHWWYRGVTTVDPHEKGALVTHETTRRSRKISTATSPGRTGGWCGGSCCSTG